MFLAPGTIAAPCHNSVYAHRTHSAAAVSAVSLVMCTDDELALLLAHSAAASRY
jgi:hypothetical protein